jgi:hypothetical protein
VKKNYFYWLYATPFLLLLVPEPFFGSFLVLLSQKSRCLTTTTFLKVPNSRPGVQNPRPGVWRYLQKERPLDKLELRNDKPSKGLSMSTIPQNEALLKHLFALLHAHRSIFKQERSYQRVVALVLAEVFVFARHTVTQLLMSLGQTEQDWSAWYRLFSQRRFCYEQAREVLFRETLRHVKADEV